MLRVIAGDLRGRRLHTPAGRPTRPTQGQVRQVLFDIVAAGVAGKRVLDLFAGTGALGIEALSRGAREAWFLERDSGALRCLRRNLEELALEGRAHVLATGVATGLKILEDQEGSFDWVLADPPYAADPGSWMARLARGGPGAVLAPSGTLVLESSRRRTIPEEIGGLLRRRSHPAGDAVLLFYGWEGRKDGETGDLSGDV